MYTKIKTLTTFSLEEDIDVFGNDLVNKVSAKNIDDELNEPTAIIAFDENGKYDLLLKKLKKVITDFSIEKYPDNKIISVFVTDDVINSKSNWFEIPN